MKMLKKDEALKLLESLDSQKTQLNDLIRSATNIIYSVAEQMTWETTGVYCKLFQAITETAQAIDDCRRHDIPV